jgi:hypothetical protein
MRSTESGFNEEVYLAAAQEKLSAAEDLCTQKRYAVAAYMAGVAVEALFIAYMTRRSVVNDAQHGLFRLAVISGFFEDLPRPERERLNGELDGVALRWRNNHRYRSEKAYREFLVREKLYVLEGSRTIREDIVLHSTDALVESARRLIHSGVTRWSQPL